jgi:hypothetical protein
MGGPAWRWEPRRRQYHLHHFLPQMPDLNFHCPAVQEAVLDIARFWLDRGVDGFRLDTANLYAHDPLLRDNPPAPADQRGDTPVMMQQHRYTMNQPESLAFLHRVRALMAPMPWTRCWITRAVHGHCTPPIRSPSSEIGPMRRPWHGSWNRGADRWRGALGRVRIMMPVAVALILIRQRMADPCKRAGLRGRSPTTMRRVWLPAGVEKGLPPFPSAVKRGPPCPALMPIHSATAAGVQIP